VGVFQIGDFRPGGVVGAIFRGNIVSAATQAKMKFNARRGIVREAEDAAIGSVAKTQLGIRIVSDSADFAPHEDGENRVDEADNGFAAAEIVGQRDDAPVPGGPGGDVVLEDVRIGEAEAVDALLDIADQETVGLWAFATEGLENGVLGVVDVLVFVDENETELLAPLPRNVGHSKHAKGVLFEVVEIHHAQFTFGVSEAGGELPGEAEQDEHLRTDPTPVLCQRIAGTIRADERMEKGRLIEEIVERLAPDSLLAAGPFLIGGKSEGRGGGALGGGGLGGKLGKGGGAFGGL